jgi:hypothetical protein
MCVCVYVCVQESLRKEEELRLVRLQTEELKRQFLAAKKKMPQLESDQKKLETLEKVSLLSFLPSRLPSSHRTAPCIP